MKEPIVAKQTNYWTDDIASMSPAPPTGHKIEGQLTADVLIVGAGFAGLSCAIHLLSEEPDLNVILVERETAGAGASSRCAGMVEPSLLGITWTLDGALGSEADARWAFNAARQRLDTLLGELDARGIACDLTRCPNVISAKTAISAEVAKGLGMRLRDFGMTAEWIDGGEARERFGTTGHGALVCEGYSVHPGKLVHNLRQNALDMGAKLYEGEVVVDLGVAEGKVAATTRGGGRITAKGCLIACGAWSGQLGIKSRTAPDVAHTWMLATERLSDDILLQVGSDQHALVAELSNSKDASYRRVHSGRILYGNFDELGHTVDATVDQQTFGRLHAAALNAMPYLEGVKIGHVWGGPILGMAHDLPFIEAYPALPNTALVVPNGSSGVPWSLLAGGMVSGIIRDGAHGDAEGERLRNILNETRMPWMTAGGMVARAIWRSMGL
ncbi:putative FAD dependent oxidoreductase [gamma proteobacterium NOR5-3]|nr:putative FAD dependent oxidoreductase [gamma proteobacterium NOR5-3]